MIRIRKMVHEDLEQVSAIERSLFTDAWTYEGFASALDLSDTCFLTALSETRKPDGDTAGEGDAAVMEVVGYCGMYLSAPEGEIVNVAVRGDRQGQGIGRQLVTALFEEGRGCGITRFILEVREGNRRAVRLYEDLGFMQIGIRRNFYEHPAENARIMVRDIENA